MRSTMTEYTEPNENLADEEWLTDAQDAEVGMHLVFDDDGDVVRYEIAEISRDDLNTVIIYYTETGGERRALTVPEINDRDDVVVV